MGKPSVSLDEFDFKNSRVSSQGFYTREIRLHNKSAKPLRVNLLSDSPEHIESEIERALEYGCNYDKIEALKADYHVVNMVKERERLSALSEIAEVTQEIQTQDDGTLLSEVDLNKIDYELAKCVPMDKIAAKFGVSERTIQIRNLNEQQNIIDIRRRLNAELEDSSIPLAHDFVRIEEIQDTLDLVKDYLYQWKIIESDTEMDAEEKLTKMAGLPNILALINTKDKLIASASREMQQRKQNAASVMTEFELTEKEREMFEFLHGKLPLLELVVARASADNGWDPSYMLYKLNKSIYKKFRKGEHHEDYEIETIKDMDLPYPSDQPVDLEDIISNPNERDKDFERMKDRDANIVPEELSKAQKLKEEMLKKLKKKKDEENNS